MTFNENSKPIYLQIADAIADAIMSGEYPEEGRLPSVREYAAQVEVNANTVMRAYDTLSQRGLIHTRRGMGYFVSPDARARIVGERSKQLLGSGLDSIFSVMMHTGITPDQLRDAYAAWLDAHKQD